MFIDCNELLNLKELLPNKELWNILTKPKEYKSILIRFNQPSGNSLGQVQASKNFLQPKPS